MNKISGYDNLGQEHWDSACDNMPQEYVDKVVATTLPKRKPAPTELNLIEKRLAERAGRKREESDSLFREHYRLVKVEYFDGGYTECWAPVTCK